MSSPAHGLNRQFGRRMSVPIVAAAMLCISIPAAAASETLRLDAKDLRALRIDAGAGDLVIEGIANGSQIEVVADFGDDEDDRRLSLTKEGSRAVLRSDTEGWLLWPVDHGRIDLRVKVPHGLELDIDDGSGEIRMSNTVGRARIDDGSGAIEVKNHRGDLDIEDGSGSIDVTSVVGDVEVEDGSGRVSIANVDGEVTIDDGSGSVDIENVTKGVVILDDGSGGLNTKNISGGVDDRS